MIRTISKEELCEMGINIDDYDDYDNDVCDCEEPIGVDKYSDEMNEMGFMLNSDDWRVNGRNETRLNSRDMRLSLKENMTGTVKEIEKGVGALMTKSKYFGLKKHDILLNKNGVSIDEWKYLLKKEFDFLNKTDIKINLDVELSRRTVKEKVIKKSFMEELIQLWGACDD